MTTLPPGWVSVETSLALLSVMNVGWAALDAFLAPYSAFDDGAIDLAYIEGKDATPTRLIPMFLDLGSGNHVDSPIVKSVQVRAMTLVPLEERGILDVDGEVVDFSPIRLECLHRLGMLLCPASLRLPARVPRAASSASA